ncbi:MAG: hypothetical protein B6D46_12530 [Polyangiaceae bacterium UTPRO1]|nr:MAG: hypothetical protein B6D46_12530 [Polyangiaceae bacterium UTPRO1]
MRTASNASASRKSRPSRASIETRRSLSIAIGSATSSASTSSSATKTSSSWAPPASARLFSRASSGTPPAAPGTTCSSRADHLSQHLRQPRPDHSTDKVFRRLLTPEILIIDDFGLRRLDATQSHDLYEVILERHRRATTTLTSNRTIDEWIPLFDDPILAHSAIDRLAHNAYQVVLEDESYRKRQRSGGDGATSRPVRRTPPHRRRLH